MAPALYGMGSDMKFQALQRRSAPLAFGPLGAHCQLWRPRHAAWCGAFFLLVSGAVQAQCPAPATLTTASLATPPAQQDLRDTVIAHRDGECGVQAVARRLSRSELEELRRAVREHAKNNPMQGALSDNAAQQKAFFP